MFEEAKQKAISEILALVEKRLSLDVLQVESVKICCKYFPEANPVMQGTFGDFGYVAQQCACASAYLDAEVGCYSRKRKAISAPSENTAVSALV
jgi:hypothetical protein